MLDSQKNVEHAFFEGMAKGADSPGVDAEALQERLIRIREAHAPSATAFAHWLGLGVQRWSNFENGTPLSKDAALRLVQKIHGLTLDYVFFGRADGLSMDLARKLGELPPSNTTKRAKG